MTLKSFLDRVLGREEEEEEEQDSWRRTYTPSGNTPAPPIGQSSPVSDPTPSRGPASAYAIRIRQLREEADRRAQPLVRATGDTGRAEPSVPSPYSSPALDTSAPSLSASQGLAPTASLAPPPRVNPPTPPKREEEPDRVADVGSMMGMGGPMAANTAALNALPQLNVVGEAAGQSIKAADNWLQRQLASDELPAASRWLIERFPWMANHLQPIGQQIEDFTTHPGMQMLGGALTGQWNPLTGEGLEQYRDDSIAANILERGYHQIQRPFDPENRVLDLVAPVVKKGRQSLDVLQVGGELIMGMGADPEKVGTSLGEIYSKGMRTLDILDATLPGPNAGFRDESGAWWNRAVDAEERLGVEGQTFAQDLRTGVNMITSAWAISQQQLVQALTPTAEQQRLATPQELEIAAANSRSMGHHGIAAIGQQFDDMANIGIQQRQAADEAQALFDQAQTFPPGSQERSELEFKAAEKAGIARKLGSTHPVELFDKNANWWMAAPAEMLFDPFAFATGFMKLAGLTPKLRRVGQAKELSKLTETQAVQAIVNGTGVGKTVPDYIQEGLSTLGNMLGRWGQTNRSQAVEETRDLWSNITQMLPGFTAKQDIRLILKTLFTTPELLVQGMPIDLFASPLIHLKDAGGVVKLPSANVAHWKVLRGIKDWFGKGNANILDDMIDALPSLAGEGDANLVAVAGDLYGLLLRGSAVKHKVSKVGLVPAGVTHAELIQDAQGLRVAYSRNGKVVWQKPYNRLSEAQAAVENFKKFLGTGQEFHDNWLRTLGELERTFLSSLTINNPLSVNTFITNALSNRFIAIADHSYGVSKLDDRIQQFVNAYQGLIPSEEIARYMNMLDQSGSYATQVGREAGQWADRIPGVKQMRKLRNWDELRVKANVETKVWAEVLEEGARFRLQPLIENLLRAAGTTDEAEIKLATGTLLDAYKKRGAQGLREALNNYANGRLRLSLGALDPNYLDIIPDAIAQQVDQLLSRVTPENIAVARQQLAQIKQQLLAAIDGELAHYGPNPPQRHYWTRLQMQEDVAEYLAELQEMTRQGLNVNVQEEIQAFAQVQQTINEQMRALFSMLSTEGGAAPYLVGLWERIQYLRHAARSDVQRYAEFAANTPEDVIRQTAGITGPLPQGMARNVMWNNFWEFKKGRWDGFGRMAQEYIDDVRQFLAASDDWRQGLPTPRGITPDLDVRPLSDALKFDIDEYFRVGEQVKGSFSTDPLKPVAQAAGQQGLDKFLAEMMLALQRNPTPGGFDSYLSAVDDVKAYYGRGVARLSHGLKKLNDDIQALKNAGQSVPQSMYNDRNRLTKQINEGWMDYFRFAFSRYRAGSLAIVQSGGTALPPIHFNPLKNWGGISITGGQPLRLMAFDIRDTTKAIVQTANGVVHRMDLEFIPPDALNQYKKMYSQGHEMLADELGKLGVKLFDEGVPDPQVQQIIDDVLAGGFQDVYTQLLDNVAGFVANRRGTQGIPGTVEEATKKMAGSIMDGLMDGLNQVANWNTKTPNVKPMDLVTTFNRDVMPQAENILAGARQAAQAMQGLSTVDFVREYGLDVVMSLFAPYSFWATRQGKNMLERMLFAPAWYSRATTMANTVRSGAQAEGMPGRAEESIDTGVTWGDITSRELDEASHIRIRNPITKWMPFTWNFIFQGYADPYRANESFEYMLGAMEEGGFPGYSKGLANAALLGSEVAGALGIGTFPWIKMGLLAATGRQDEIHLGALGIPFDLLGYVSLMSGGQGKVAGVQVAPHYAPFLAARIAADDFTRGGITEEQYNGVAAALQAMGQGFELDPQFVELFPEAAALAEGYMRRAGERGLFQRLVGSILGLSPTTVDEGEVQRRQDQELYRRMGYEGDGLPGGKVRSEVYDSDSPHFNAGIAASGKLYGVMEEPESEQDRQDLSMVHYDVYSPQKDAIKEQFDTQMQALLDQFGGVTEENERAFNDIVQEMYKERGRQMDELNAEFPLSQNREYEPSMMRGWNPEEAKQEVVRRLYFAAGEDPAVAALDPGPYPPEGSDNEVVTQWHERDEAHKQAWNEKWQEYLQDEARVREAFGDYPFIDEAVGLQPSTAAIEAAPQPPAVQLPDVEADMPVAGAGEAGEPLVSPLNAAPPAAQPPAAQAPAAAAPVAPAAQAPAVQPPAAQANPYNAPTELWDLMVKYGEQYGVDPGLIASVAFVETRGSYQPDAHNESTGAMGMMQFLPDTWEDVSRAINVTDPNDPEQAIHGAAYYLNWIREQLPENKRTDEWVLAAYHDGIGNAKQVGAIAQLSNNANEYVKLSQPYLSQKQGGEAAAQVAEAPQSASEPQRVADKMVESQTAGMPFDGDYALTQSFGVNPERYKSWGGHMGLDYKMPVGTELVATAEGTVIATGFSPAGGKAAVAGTGGFGNFILIKHAGGYQTEYAHLSEIQVNIGDKVTQGQVIGLSGHTGVSDFPHLHFGVKQEGKYIDPHVYLQNATIPVQNVQVAQAVPPADPVDKVIAAAGGQAPKAPGVAAETPSGNIQWGTLPTFEEMRGGSRGPAEAEYRQQRDTVLEGRETRVQTTYPDYYDAWNEYRGLSREEKDAYKGHTPEMRAVSHLAYNRSGWEYVERTWGEGAMLTFARIPKSEFYGGEEGARDAYYIQHPEAMLIKSWLEGRPRVWEEEIEAESEDFAYNNGADYQEAERLFGADIWDVVKRAMQLPAYNPDDKSTGKIWGQFHEANPQYAQWRDWWYALLPDNANRSQQHSNYRPWNSWRSWGGGGGFKAYTWYNPNIRYEGGIRAPRMDLSSPPRYGSSGFDAPSPEGWRRWLTDSNLTNWRR